MVLDCYDLIWHLSSAVCCQCGSFSSRVGESDAGALITPPSSQVTPSHHCSGLLSSEHQLSQLHRVHPQVQYGATPQLFLMQPLSLNHKPCVDI